MHQRITDILMDPRSGRSIMLQLKIPPPITSWHQNVNTHAIKAVPRISPALPFVESQAQITTNDADATPKMCRIFPFVSLKYRFLRHEVQRSLEACRELLSTP